MKKEHLSSICDVGGINIYDKDRQCSIIRLYELYIIQFYILCHIQKSLYTVGINHDHSWIFGKELYKYMNIISIEQKNNWAKINKTEKIMLKSWFSLNYTRNIKEGHQSFQIFFLMWYFSELKSYVEVQRKCSAIRFCEQPTQNLETDMNLGLVFDNWKNNFFTLKISYILIFKEWPLLTNKES